MFSNYVIMLMLQHFFNFGGNHLLGTFLRIYILIEYKVDIISGEFKMVTYIIARQLGGKPVITVSGEELGRLDDVVVDEKTGQFISIIVEPVGEELPKIAYPKDKDGNLIIPYDSVNAISKVVVVKE